MILSTIKGKLIFFTLSLSLIPLIVITTIFYIHSSSALKHQIIRELTSVAEAKKQHILTFMEAKKGRVIDFSSDRFIKYKLDKTAHGRALKHYEVVDLNKYLSMSKMSLDSDILAITIIDKTGKVASSTNEVLVGEDLSYVEEFKQLVNESHRNFFVGQPYYSSYLEKTCIFISALIAPKVDGKTTGIISVAFDITALNEVTSNRVGMGKSGEIYLVNRDKLMLTRSRFLDNEPLKLAVDTEPVRKIIENGEETAGIYSDYRGVTVVGASAYMPEYDWILLVEMDKAEVFAPVKRLGFIAWIVGVIGVVTVTGVGIILAISASRPIINLKNATEIFSSGNLDYRVKVTRKDEIGDLASSFNSMAEKLQEEIIERKQAEDEVKKAHAKDRQLITAIPSILVYIDGDDRVIEWNKTAEHVFEIASADVVGRPFSGCGIQWDSNGIIEQILGCRNRMQPTRIDDVRFKNSNGKICFLGITVNPVEEDNGRPPTLLVLGIDITERKILESQLIQSQKLESIGQLAAGIAHEINTPTQYVGDNTRFLQDAFNDLCKLINRYTDMLKACKNGGVTDVLIREVEAMEKEADVEYLTEEIPRAIQQSLEGVERVTKIVRAMKEFSHPGTNEKAYLDINKAIESTITVARNEWKYVAEMATSFDTSLPLVSCLPDEFNQVILNVIINAAHAISDVAPPRSHAERGNENAGKGAITISTHRDGNWAEVRIQDTGTGIPEAIRSKIFDPFFTTKEVGKGTGQGLAIAHDIVVKKHDGTITFETEMGKGTTFIIRLPIG